MCTHNTVRMRFDLERAEYNHLHRADASFPRFHFSTLRDRALHDAYAAAIERQVVKARLKDGEAS